MTREQIREEANTCKGWIRQSHASGDPWFIALCEEETRATASDLGRRLIGLDGEQA